MSMRVAGGWRRFVPWQGPATRADWALMGAILGVVALALLLRPLKPFLLAEHPAALAFLTGVLTAIGGASLASLTLIGLALAVPLLERRIRPNREAGATGAGGLGFSLRRGG